MTKKDFNELVYNYGASGTQVLEGLSADECEVVAMAWSESEKIDDIAQSDETINSYYKAFQIAERERLGKNVGLGYHGSNGRPLKAPEDKKVFKNTTISGTPEEIAKLQSLARDSGKSLSRYILDELL